MNTAILGYGIVGRATHHAVLGDRDDVDTFDLHNRQEFWTRTYDLIFVCLPTATQDDLGYVEHVCQRIAAEQPRACIVVRSTVPPGFISQRLANIHDRMIYFPEFLRERCWREDSQVGAWVIGCLPPTAQVLQDLAQDREVLIMTHAEAEMLKMMVNAYAATRVVFANHVYDLCQHLGADYAQVRQGYAMVNHQDQDYLDVREDLRGFGGKCLPKDLAFLIQAFDSAALRQTLFSSVRMDNFKWPVTVRQDITDAD